MMKACMLYFQRFKAESEVQSVQPEGALGPVLYIPSVAVFFLAVVGDVGSICVRQNAIFGLVSSSPRST